MKMIMIAYNEAVDLEVMEILEQGGAKNFSKIAETFGRGDSSGTHMGTDIWPGLNNLLFAACEESAVPAILAAVRALRKTIGKTGIKAFVMPLEEIT